MTGELMRKLSLSQAPRSTALQRGEQKGSVGYSARVPSRALRQVGHQNFICLRAVWLTRTIADWKKTAEIDTKGRAGICSGTAGSRRDS